MTRGRLGALALLSTLACSTQASATETFVVEGYESRSSPRLLSEGRYDELIAQSSRKERRDRTQASLAATNLCVGRIKTGQLEAAGTACDAAIAAARGDLRPASVTGSMSERWLALARAYSNRAVLHWATGNRAAAEADLVKAGQYAPRAHFVSRNALALSERGSVGNALAAIAER